MDARPGARRASIALGVAGPVLLVGGIAAAAIEWSGLRTPAPMPTLPVGAYTGYRFDPAPFALDPAFLYLFIGIGVLGAALLVGAVALHVTGRGSGPAAPAASSPRTRRPVPPR